MGDVSSVEDYSMRYDGAPHKRLRINRVIDSDVSVIVVSLVKVIGGPIHYYYDYYSLNVNTVLLLLLLLLLYLQIYAHMYSTYLPPLYLLQDTLHPTSAYNSI